MTDGFEKNTEIFYIIWMSIVEPNVNAPRRPLLDELIFRGFYVILKSLVQILWT